MPQLKEDEWPDDDQPTTQEEQVKTDESTSAPGDTATEYPPELPPEALPTDD